MRTSLLHVSSQKWNCGVETGHELGHVDGDCSVYLDLLSVHVSDPGGHSSPLPHPM